MDSITSWNAFSHETRFKLPWGLQINLLPVWLQMKKNRFITMNNVPPLPPFRHSILLMWNSLALGLRGVWTRHHKAIYRYTNFSHAQSEFVNSNIYCNYNVNFSVHYVISQSDESRLLFHFVMWYCQSICFIFITPTRCRQLEIILPSLSYMLQSQTLVPGTRVCLQPPLLSNRGSGI